MDHRTFDRLSRNLAAQSTRRGFLRGIGALAAAGFAATAFGQRRSFTRAMDEAGDDLEEKSVLLFEELGRIAHDHDGTCDELATKVQAFQEQYSDQIKAIQAEEAKWTAEHRASHADTYGERRMVVVDRVTAVLERCHPELDIDRPPSTPVGATPLATPSALAGLAALVPTGTDRASIRRLASQDSGCTLDNYNFLPEAYCAKQDSDWTSPSFQWPAYCPSGSIDGSCDLCEDVYNGSTIPNICTQYWPQDCNDANDQNVCDVKYHHSHGGIAGAICESVDQSKIISSTKSRCYSRDSDWNSPEFTWSLYCPKGYIDDDCIDCQTDSSYAGLAGQDICTHYWPQDCDKSGENICYIGFHVDEDVVCCHENCPMSTGDCIASTAYAIFGNPACGSCHLMWCGSSSHCYSLCIEDGCCRSACGQAIIPITSSASPVASPTGDPVATPTSPPGTPLASPTANPTDAPTSVPTTLPTAMPTNPPTIEPTNPPTSVPTSPPTAAPTSPPPATPDATPE